MPLTASHLHCTAGSSRLFAAIRNDAGLCCGSRLRKGEVFAYIGLIPNPTDLKAERSLLFLLLPHLHPGKGTFLSFSGIGLYYTNAFY